MIKYLRTALIFLLTLALIFSGITLPFSPVSAQPTPEPATKHREFPIKPAKNARVEIPEWRTANSKHFLKDDGTFTAEIANENIFYQDPVTRRWKDIDNTLVPSNKAGFAWKNKANRFEADFSSQLGSGSINKFTIDKSSLEFIPLDVLSSTVATNANKLTYNTAYPNTDLSYTVNSDGVKESIILNTNQAPTTFTFELKLTNLKYQTAEDGSIVFTHADTKDFAFQMPKPFMYESGEIPAISDQVTQTIRQKDGKAYLDIRLDANWLNQPNRNFPVTVDPSVCTEQIVMHDAFVSQLNPTGNYFGASSLYAGNTTTYGKTESYLRFPIDALPDGAVILYANAFLYSSLAKSTTTNLNIYPVNSWWAQGTLNWNNKPAKGSLITTLPVSQIGWQSFNIKDLVNYWYTGKTPNNGIALVATPDTAEPAGFSSSDHATTTLRPYLVVDYLYDPQGINTFWTYTSDGVMPFKGNLFLNATDLATPGLGIDAVVTRSYNSRQSTKIGVFGAGWLSNLDMQVWDLTGSVAFLDATGTRHIFDRDSSSGQYSPPKGITLSLTRDDVNLIFTIKTTDNTLLFFDMLTGKLTKIVDSNNNTTTYTTEAATGDLIITDPSGRITRIHFLADGKVDYALDPKGRKVTYTYNAAGLLKDATLSFAGESVGYSYTYVPNKTLLATITDPKGNTVTYTYNNYDQVSTVSRLINGQTSTNTYVIDSAAVPYRTVTVTGMNGEQIIYYANEQANIVQTDVKLNASETATTVYHWSEYNFLTQIDRPGNQITKIEYAGSGNPIKITTPDNNNENTNYDLRNNMISDKDSLSNVEGTTYNSTDNPTDITDPVGSTIMLDYASNGNLTSLSEAMSLAENYVYNSGFEMSGTIPTGWSASRSLGAGDIYEVSTTVQAKGYKSFHAKSGNVNGLYGVMSYEIPVASQMPYDLSADLKLGANTTTEFKVTYYDASGVVIQELTNLSLSTAGIYGTEWHHKSTQATAPFGAVKGKIQIGIKGIGEAWFDNVVFEGGTGRTGNILVTNQSFDYDLDLSDWADEWYPGPVSSDISIDYTEKIHGVASEKIVGSPSDYKYVSQSLNLSGTKGQKFSLSGWGKQDNVPATGGEWGLKIRFIGSTTGALQYIPFDRSLTAWQQQSRVLTADVDFDAIEVFAVFNLMPATAIGWFDDFQLNMVNIPTATVSKYNYADNSSFEYNYDTSNWLNWPDGWYKSSGDGSSHNTATSWVDLTASNGNVYTGTHAIKITNPNSWVSIARTGEKAPYNVGDAYTAVGYIKTVNVTSSALVLIHSYDQNDNWLGQVASNTVTGTKDWTRVTAVVNSANLPSGTKKLAVGIQMTAGTGTAYFDNIRLQEGELLTKFQYDPNGNYLTGITSPTSNTVNMTKEATTGNTLTFTDSLGNTITADYNMYDQIKSYTFPYQGALGITPVNKSYTYSYDTNGNLTEVTDPNANTWASFQYNEQNQIKLFEEKVTWSGVQSTNPWVYSYDLSGRLDKVTLPSGKYTDFGYDQASRLTELAYGTGVASPSLTYSFAYDLNSNLTSFGSGSSNYTVEYDIMNRATKITEPTTTNFLENSYDANSQRTSLKVTNGGNIWNYLYYFDNRGNQKQFKDSTTGKSVYYLNDEAERLIKEYYGNDTGTYYQYDQEGRIAQLRIEGSGGETEDKFRFDYDANNNITKIWSDMDGSWVEYIYDSLGQLLREKYSDTTTIEYQYDELGNRTKVIRDGVTTNYSYNAEKNRLVSVGSSNYGYDSNGNVTTDGTYSYIYGDDNRLKEVKQGSTTIASFTYDALGRRATKTAGGVTLTYHYDGDEITYVTQSDGKIYRFANDHFGKPIFMSYNNNQYWYHYDQHGNVIRLTDNNGTTVAKYKYDAFGNITYQWGTAGVGSEIVELNPYRYSGYIYDSEIDKYYLKARYYDAKIGRFLAKDPLAVEVADVLGLNAYTYAGNNPVMLVDPTGFAAVLDYGGGPGASIGAVPTGGYGGLIRRSVVPITTIGFSQYKSKSKTKTKTKEEDNDPKTGIVYLRTVSESKIETVGQQYVGRSINPDRYVLRQAEHKAKGAIIGEEYIFEIIDQNIPLSQLAVYEQKSIIAYGKAKSMGGTLQNKINAIAKKRWSSLGITGVETRVK